MRRNFKKMVTIALIALMAAVMPAGRSFAAAGTADAVPKAVIEKITAAIPNTKIDSITPTKVKGLYEVAAKGNVVYVDEKGKYLLVGELFEFASGRNITADRRKSLIKPFNWTSLPLKDAIRINGPDSERKIAVFDDPDCPYCRKFHSEIPAITKAGVEVYVFLTPIKQIHPLAYDKSVSVWCNVDRDKTLKAAMNGEAVEAGKCEHPVDRNMDMMKNLGVAGTPTIFLSNGQRMDGYVTASRILEAYGEK